MSKAVIKSLLKETIQNLPEGSTMKAESVAPMLLKKGVKQEELDFSGIELPGKGKVTREELLGLEQQRKDMFYVTEVDPHYKSVSLPGGQANPTYREKILRFEQVDEIGSRYTSSHFPDVENYLAHTRIYDEDFNGTPTRVLQEIQSDLHQQGRQTGYVNGAAASEADVANYIKMYEDADNFYYGEPTSVLTEDEAYEAMDNAVNGLRSLGLNFDDQVNPRDYSAREFINEFGEGVPKSPYEKTWLTKTIEREIVDAVNEGRQQLAIPISGAVDKLNRGSGVQRWYETTVVDTAKKVAKRAGMDFELTAPRTTLDDSAQVQYVIIKPKFKDTKPLSKLEQDELAKLALKEALGEEYDKARYAELQGRTFSADSPVKQELASQASFTLYATPTATAFAAYTAYKSGYSTDEVHAKLSEQGYDEDEILEIDATTQKIAQAEAAGYSREEIEAYLGGKEITTTVESNNPTGPSRDAVSMQEGQAMKREGGFGGLGVPRRLYADVKQEAFDRVLNDQTMSASDLVTSLQTLQPVLTSDTMTSIPAFFGNKEALQRYDAAREASRQKIIDIAKRDYNIDLVWQGGDVGTEAWYVNTPEGPVEVTPGFWQELSQTKGEIVGGITGAIAGFKYAPPHPVTKAIGAAVGGTLGAVAGSQLDYLATAMEMNADMEAEVAAHKALNAAELAIVGEVISYPVAKTLGASWRGIVRAKNMIFDGNTQGAYQALKEVTFLSDDQIDEIVTKFERLAGPLEGSKEQKAIKAVTLGERGMQDLARVAGVIDPQASRATIKAIDDRAKNLLDLTADLTDSQVSRMYIKDLQNYTGDVRKFYDDVKAKAVQSPKGLNFDWDFDKLAIEPVLEHLNKKITDPVTSQKFLLQAQRIRTFSESRNFGDLIELRQLTNDFLYNKNITKADDKKMLRDVIKRIDEAIVDGAPAVVEQPEQWLEQWATARLKYTEMKKVEQSALYKMVFDKKGNVRPVQPETVVKGLTKYISALDGNFEAVMSKIPAGGRAKYESAVVDHLAQTYTAGVKGGMNAVNFPLLADELAKVNFTTPDARAMKNMITDMADVFKNDVHLAQASGLIEIPKFQSYLTTDPIVRAKFEIASGVFNYIKTWAPGKTQRNYALVKQAAQLLEKPLDAKLNKELLKEFAADATMTESIKQLQRDAAQAAASGKDVSGAKLLVDANGVFVKSGTQAAKRVPAHRVANEETVKLIADRESVTVDNPMIDTILKQYGYVAVTQGSDRLRFLGAK